MLNNPDNYQNYIDQYQQFAGDNKLGEIYLAKANEKITFSSVANVLRYDAIPVWMEEAGLPRRACAPRNDGFSPLTGMPYSDNRIILIIPSIFNSPEILFLNQDASFVDHLRSLGEVYLIDWQEIANPDHTIDDYAIEVVKVLEFLYKRTNKKIDIIGHCIGGSLALAASVLVHELICSITQFTSPWDFSYLAGPRAIHQYTKLDELIRSLPLIPKIYPQMLFFLLSPSYFQNKIEKFLKINDSKKKELFFRVEHWLLSGHPLPRLTYFQMMEEMVDANILAKGKWIINDIVIDPLAARAPICLIVAQNDVVAPPNSILPLRKKLKNSTMIEVKGGHISYLIGAELTNFFKKYQSWFRGLNEY